MPIELRIELPIGPGLGLLGSLLPSATGLGQGAGAGTPWARGRGRDPLGQGPRPGPLGPGAWGPLGPRCRIRVESVATYYQASYLLSGKLPTIRHAPKRSRRLCTQQPHTDYLLSGRLPTIRQATYYQASYLLSDKPSAVMKLATYCQASYLLSGKPSAV